MTRDIIYVMGTREVNNLLRVVFQEWAEAREKGRAENAYENCTTSMD